MAFVTARALASDLAPEHFAEAGMPLPDGGTAAPLPSPGACSA
ncbi:hypothetical protein [Altericroceibacterium xinjiangense]|nr:hypothetical protein [Altericroceibacterium xinjiangense]